MLNIREFFDQVPFFRMTVGLISGIIFSYFFTFPLETGLYLLASVIILLALIIFIQRRWLFSFLLFGILFTLGAYLHQRSFPAPVSSDSANMFYHVQIISPTAEKTKSLSLEAEIIPTRNSWFRKKERVLLYLPKNERSQNLLPGDNLFFHGKLNTPKKLGNPYEFDYSQFLLNKKISRTGYIPDKSWEKSPNSSFTIWRYAETCRRKIFRIYQEAGIADQQLAILSALSLGYRDFLTEEIKLTFSKSGITHILAVSGLHVGILIGILKWILNFVFKTKKSNVPKTIILILILWGFAFISGLTPSVIRASLMFSLLLLGQTLERKANIFNSIFASAFLILIYNPLILFQVSFQLSYLAVTSIVYFQPKISRLLIITNKTGNYFWQLFTVSLAVQIGTFPIIIYYFHVFPNYFWLSNFFAIPLTGIILYEAIILIIFSSLSQLLPFGGLIVSTTIKLFQWAITLVENLPHAITTGFSLNEYHLMLLYLVIILMSGYLLVPKQKFRLHFSLFAILFISLINLHQAYDRLTQNQIIIFNDTKTLYINLISGKKSYLLSPEIDEINTKTTKYLKPICRNRNTNPPEFVTFNSTELSIHGIKYHHPFIWFNKKVLAIADKTLNDNAIPNQIKISYLLITPHTDNKNSRLNAGFYNQVIFSPNCYENQSVIHNKNNHSETKKYDVKNEGAWVKNFRMRLKRNIFPYISGI